MDYIEFRKKIATDDDFAKKFTDAKDPATLIKLAAAEGFNFTEDDIKNNTEILPEELEKSAGGDDNSTVAYSDWFVTPSAIVTPN